MSNYYSKFNFFNIRESSKFTSQNGCTDNYSDLFETFLAIKADTCKEEGYWRYHSLLLIIYITDNYPLSSDHYTGTPS